MNTNNFRRRLLNGGGNRNRWVFKGTCKDSTPGTIYIHSRNEYITITPSSDGSFEEILDLEGVTSLYGMLEEGSLKNNLTSLDLSRFDTSEVTNMERMFNLCIWLVSLDVSGFDTSKVIIMEQMFRNCRFASLDLSNFDTHNVTNMSNMFEGNINIKSLDLSNFTVQGYMTNTYRMFGGCWNLTYLDLSGWNWYRSNTTFEDCYDLSRVKVAGCKDNIISDIISVMPTMDSEDHILYWEREGDYIVRYAV